jgi:hypothetical protein
VPSFALLISDCLRPILSRSKVELVLNHGSKLFGFIFIGKKYGIGLRPN